MIIAIVAIANNFAIGKDGKLPWHHPADLKFFKENTTGNAVVMGFHTWQSIGKPLPKRLNIVLSRRATLENPTGVLLLRSKEEVLALAGFLKGDLYIIGGAQTYAAFADVIEKWFVTEVPLEIADADAFMPENFLEDFRLIDKMELGNDLVVKAYQRS
jgi:dihydrofolate reductase